MSWVNGHLPGYRRHRSQTVHTKLSFRDEQGICGTYEILMADKQQPKTSELSEIVISSDGDSLYGRYRIGLDIHGLFRTNLIPSHFSTEVIECAVAVENYNSKDGKWWTGCLKDVKHSTDSVSNSGSISGNSDNESDAGLGESRGADLVDLSLDTSEGIMFLGNGLIKLSPAHFAHKPAKICGDVLFGIRTSDYKEPVEVLKKCWDALYSYNPLEGREWTENEVRGWDEKLVDGLVDRLSA